jgi:putative (di)nucleoside polyphosphate hydrolase
MKPSAIAKLPYRPCVGVMLVNSDGRVFVGQRRDRDQDAWQMPQGGIDKGEDVRTAALRELWEETGVTADLVRIDALTDHPIPYDLPLEVVPTIWGGRYRGQEQTWVLMRFLGTDDQISIATTHPEFTRWEWCAPALLVPRIVDFKRAVYEQVVAQFKDLI